MTRTDPFLGKTLGGVQIREKLGSGGMGSVYLGTQTGLGRNVAVKILPEHLAKNAEYISRFRSEAATAGKLEHTNIVAIYDVGCEEGLYYIIMQYVEGESLQSIIDVMGVLHPRDAARVAIGILHGLGHAHKAGIVHRDIKPDNVLITADNQPKILDFGLALALDSNVRHTANNTVVGTPFFISPEQARGKPADARSDIYSVGVTFYYLLTGRVPFNGQDPLAILNMHIHETPVSPINLNPRIPPALNEIVTKMLAKRPEDRYPTADAAAKAIQAYLDGRLSAPASRSTTARPARRSRSSWSAYAAAVAGALAVMTVIGWTVRRSTPEPVRLPTARRPAPAPAPHPDIDKVRQEVSALLKRAEREGAQDTAIFAACLQDIDAIAVRYANLKNEVGPILEEGRAALLREAEHHAIRFEREIRPRVEAARQEGDVLLVRNLLRDFPRALASITPTGRRIDEEMRAAEELLQKCIAEDFKHIPERIAEDEFDEANALIERLLAVAPPEYRERLLELKNASSNAEAERRFQILPKLANQVADLEKEVATRLVQGRSDSAWIEILDFIEKYPPRKLAGSLVRMSSVPIPTMREMIPSKAAESELEYLLARLERDYPEKDEDLPAYRLRTLGEDILRLEWLRRRAEQGIQRLAGCRIYLETFGVDGKVESGDPPLLAPDQGAPHILRVSELVSRDVAFLAAAADHGPNRPMEAAFRSANQRPLCMAIALGYLYSSALDRYAKARKWMTQANAHGMAVPAFRLDDLDLGLEMERERMARELLEDVHRHKAAKEFQDAHKALDKVEEEHRDKEHYAILASILREHRALLLLDEADYHRMRQDWAKVKELSQRLRREHGDYRIDVTDSLYHEALLHLGTWTAVPLSQPTAASKLWVWDGKAQGTRAPAKAENNALVLTEAGGYRPLFLDPSRTEGATGFRAKVRLNQQQQAFDMALLFDARDPLGDMRRLVIRSTGHLELSTRVSDRWELDEIRDLPVKLKPREFYELAFVSDGAETVFYFGPPGAPEAMFSIRAGLTPKSMFGIWATADSTFMDLQVR